jgi:hypothetical protein
MEVADDDDRLVLCDVAMDFAEVVVRAVMMYCNEDHERYFADE